MENITKEDLKNLISAYNITSVQDIEGAIKDLFGKTMQTLLEKEMEVHLGYAKHAMEEKNTTNSRNGFSSKTVQTTHGPMTLSIPRDRQSQFEPQVVKKHERDVASLEERIISMYACGLSTRDISEQVKAIYGAEISAEKVSQLTDTLLPLIMEWRNRPLESWYPIIFIDGMFFKVNENHKVQKRALYLIIGINPEGMKEVLGMWMETNEHAKGWLDILNDIHNRGVKRICFVCADGLPGLDKAVHAVFPQSKFQRCIVHQLRQSLRFVSYKERKAMARDLKNIYQADTLEMAEHHLGLFAEKWKSKYPHSVRSWIENWDHLSIFFEYPKELRRLIYTTNPIESVNRQIRKLTKTKGHFPTEQAVFKIVYLGLQQAAKKWTVRMNHWDMILDQLLIKFEDLRELM